MLPNYGGRGKVALAELVKGLGLPGKPDQMDRSKVEELVDAGRSAEVADYCKSDVVKLSHLVALPSHTWAAFLDLRSGRVERRRSPDWIKV